MVARHHMMRRVASLARESVKVLSAVIVLVVVVAYSFGNFEGSTDIIIARADPDVFLGGFQLLSPLHFSTAFCADVTNGIPLIVFGN